MSKRQYDENGWLTVIDNPIAKSGVFDYLGSEIGAPEPDRVYQVLCSPDEFGNTDFLASLNLIPIIDDHEIIGDIGTSTDDRPAAGVTGGNTHYKHPYILSSIKVYSDKVQRGISAGKVQLSTAYTCDWIEEVGEYEGKSYQYRQIPKVGNHLAVVDRGRFGSDIAVQNSAYAFNSGGFLPMTQEELLAEIAKLDEEAKAALLAALNPAQNEEETAENGADDAEASADIAAEAVAEAVAADEAGDTATAETAVETAVEAAETALEDAEALQEKITETAMNAAVRHIDKRNAMVTKVRPFIGAVPAVAMNSAETVAAYTCKKLGVPHAKGSAGLAINAYLHGRKPVSEQAKAAMNAKPADSETIKTKLWGAK